MGHTCEELIQGLALPVSRACERGGGFLREELTSGGQNAGGEASTGAG